MRETLKIFKKEECGVMGILAIIVEPGSFALLKKGPGKGLVWCMDIFLSIVFKIHFVVLVRSHFFFFFKKPDEVIDIVITDFCADFIYG